MQLLVQIFFWSSHGCGLCPDSTIRYFGEKCLKNAMYTNCFQTKVVTNQKSQLLYHVTFFDFVHHYGVIAASHICGVSRKYCAVLRNWFFLFLFFFFLFWCYHNNSWKPQLIRTKFSHTTFDWNSSTKFENGHYRSHITHPYWRVSAPPESSKPPILMKLKPYAFATK